MKFERGKILKIFSRSSTSSEKYSKSARERSDDDHTNFFESFFVTSNEKISNYHETRVFDFKKIIYLPTLSRL